MADNMNFMGEEPGNDQNAPFAAGDPNEIGNDLGLLLDAAGYPAGDALNNINNFPPEDSPEWGFGQLGGPEDAPGNLVAQAPPYLDGANEALRRYHESYIAEHPYGVYPNTAPQLPAVFAPQQVPFAPLQEPFAPQQHPFAQHQPPFAPQQDPVIAAPPSRESAPASDRRVLPRIWPNANWIIRCTVCKQEKFHEEFRGKDRRLATGAYAAQCNKCAVKKREASRKLAAKRRAERERRRREGGDGSDGGDGGGGAATAGAPVVAGV